MQRIEVVTYDPVQAFYWDNPEYAVYVIGITALIVGGAMLFAYLNKKFLDWRRGLR